MAASRPRSAFLRLLTPHESLNLYVITRADGGSQLRALDRSNGTETWRSTNLPLINAAPVATQHNIFVRTVDGRILAFHSTKE